MPEQANPLLQSVFEVLSPLLGRFTALKAIEIACQRAKLQPEAVGTKDIAELVLGLRPMLRTLLGEHLAARVIEDIQRRTGAPT
jgi:hypothetical protein